MFHVKGNYLIFVFCVSKYIWLDLRGGIAPSMKVKLVHNSLTWIIYLSMLYLTVFHHPLFLYNSQRTLEEKSISNKGLTSENICGHNHNAAEFVYASMVFCFQLLSLTSSILCDMLGLGKLVNASIIFFFQLPTFHWHRSSSVIC